MKNLKNLKGTTENLKNLKESTSENLKNLKKSTSANLEFHEKHQLKCYDQNNSDYDVRSINSENHTVKIVSFFLYWIHNFCFKQII